MASRGSDGFASKTGAWAAPLTRDVDGEIGAELASPPRGWRRGALLPLWAWSIGMAFP